METKIKNLKFYDFNDLVKLKPQEYYGYFYIIEFGNYIKIGCTRKPYERIRSLKSQLENYSDGKLGRIIFSNECVNYTENEYLLHTHFKEFRKFNTELFDLSIEEFLGKYSNISIEFSHDISMYERVNKFIDGVQNFIVGDNDLNKLGYETEILSRALLKLNKKYEELSGINRSNVLANCKNNGINKLDSNCYSLELSEREVIALSEILIKHPCQKLLEEDISDECEQCDFQNTLSDILLKLDTIESAVTVVED